MILNSQMENSGKKNGCDGALLWGVSELIVLLRTTDKPRGSFCRPKEPRIKERGPRG